MIFLDYLYNLPNGTSGIDSIITDTVTMQGAGNTFPIISMTLFFIFMVIFVGGITRQKTRTGTADYSAWAVVASMATLIPALLFSISVGFISLDVLVIVVSMNIVSATWFFIDRKASEI